MYTLFSYCQLWLLSCSAILFPLSTALAQANTPYTLQAKDVIIENGVITSCLYDFNSKHIIIPEIIGQDTIRGIKCPENEKEHTFVGKGIRSIQLPATLQSIGKFTFADNHLSSIVIPDGVLYIDQYAFFRNKLERVQIPAGIKAIGGGCFNSNAIHTINGKPSKGLLFGITPNGLTNDTIVIGYGGSATVINFIPSTVTTIGQYAFAANEISSVTLPESVTRIERNAFSGNQLKMVTIGKNVRYLGENAFNFNKLTTVRLMNNIPHMGGYIFASNQITRLYLPDNMDTIPESFCERNKLTTFACPKSIKVIKRGAFYRNDLNEVTFNKGLTSIGASAFEGNELTAITLPEALKHLGGSAFDGNQIKEVSLPSSIQSIDWYVFRYNTLSYFILPQNNDPSFLDWRDKDDRPYHAGDTISDFRLTLKAQFWYTLRSEDVAFSDGEIKRLNTWDQRNIVIPDTIDGQRVTSIGEKAFYRHGLLRIKIPNTVTEIKGSAFQGNCLEQTPLPASLLHLGRWAFSDNWNDTLMLPQNDSAAFIGWKCFNQILEGGANLRSSRSSCDALFWEVLSPDDISMEQNTILSYHGHARCLIIPEYVAGQRVINIGQSAFSNQALLKVQLPASLQGIGSNAFYHNELDDITLPKNTVFIDSYAFERNNFSSITLQKPDIENFEYWEDSNDNKYEPGQVFSRFSSSIWAHTSKRAKKKKAKNQK